MCVCVRACLRASVVRRQCLVSASYVALLFVDWIQPVRLLNSSRFSLLALVSLSQVQKVRVKKAGAIDLKEVERRATEQWTLDLVTEVSNETRPRWTSFPPPRSFCCLTHALFPSAPCSILPPVVPEFVAHTVATFPAVAR